MVTGKLIRNAKLLQAINLGRKIVTLKWLEDCKKEERFVEIVDKYLNIDKEFEKKYKCNLKSLYNSQGAN